MGCVLFRSHCRSSTAFIATVAAALQLSLAPLRVLLIVRVSPGCLVLPQQKKQNKQKQQQKLQFSIRCRKQDIHIPFLQSSFLFLLRAVIWQLSNSLLLMINPARALLNLAATISLPRGILFSQLLPICQLAASINTAV